MAGQSNYPKSSALKITPPSPEVLVMSTSMTCTLGTIDRSNMVYRHTFPVIGAVEHCITVIRCLTSAKSIAKLPE